MRATTEFLVPAALDTHGRLVLPAKASKRATYRCPGCEERVDVHAGEKKRRHFHHRSSSCSAESVVHLTAKNMIRQAVEDWLAGGPPLLFVRSCAHADCEARCRQPIPTKVAAIALEAALPSGHVADVVLLARGRAGSTIALPVAVIEVHHTHAVDAAKAFEIGVPWIEVDATQACEGEGRELVVVTDRFLPWLCTEHAPTRGQGHRAERHDRALAARLARKLSFRLADFPGFRIATVARCPRGHDTLVFAWEGKEPPWPRPPLVVAIQNELDSSFHAVTRRTAKTFAFKRSYASACATCGEVVGSRG